MRLPSLRRPPQKTARYTRFYGLEAKPGARAGAFPEELNLCADDYPLLSVRKRRARYLAPGETCSFTFDSPVTHVCSTGDSLVVCTENGVWYRGARLTPSAFKSGVADRRATPLGADFLVTPDNVFVKTGGDAPELVSLAFERTFDAVEVTPVYEDCTPFAVRTFWLDASAPIDPDEWPDWVDPSSGRLLHYHFTDGKWELQGEFYMMLEAETIGQGLSPGDRILLDVYSYDAPRVKEEFTVVKREDDRILVTGNFILGGELGENTHLKRLSPVCDLTIAHGNRLWGCRWGVNAAGQRVNEIFASALGDPTRWYDFEGISTDAWTVSVGAPGPFTGVAELGQELVFFKEDCILRVSGYTPGDFCLTVTPAPGVRPGAERSVAATADKVVYLSSGGVSVFDGASVRLWPRDYETADLKNVFASFVGGNYVLAAERGNEKRLYLYDPVPGLWHTQDNDVNAVSFVRLFSQDYYFCRGDGYAYTLVSPRSDASPVSVCPWGTSLSLTAMPEGNVSWFAVLGPLTPPDPAFTLTRLALRLKLSQGARLSVEAKAGSTGKWRPLGTLRRTFSGTFALRAPAPKSDALMLRLSGEGECTVHALELTAQSGGEVRDLGVT